jgi:hypothetical protein
MPATLTPQTPQEAVIVATVAAIVVSRALRDLFRLAAVDWSRDVFFSFLAVLLAGYNFAKEEYSVVFVFFVVFFAHSVVFAAHQYRVSSIIAHQYRVSSIIQRVQNNVDEVARLYREKDAAAAAAAAARNFNE